MKEKQISFSVTTDNTHFKYNHDFTIDSSPYRSTYDLQCKDEKGVWNTYLIKQLSKETARQMIHHLVDIYFDSLVSEDKEKAD